MKKLNEILLNIERKLNFQTGELFSSILYFQVELKNILLPFNDAEQTETFEFDLILMQYIELYNNLKSPNIAKNILYPNKENNQYLYLSMLLLFKSFIHDFITLRNCYVSKFEAQFNSIFRNLFEKFKIFILCIYDLDFAQKYVFNNLKETNRVRYNKYLSPRKINKRLNDNIEKIKKSIKTNKLINMSMSLALSSYKLFNDITKDIYSINSLFIHYNDGNELLKYYNEEGKYNISLYNGCSKYFKFRINYAIEALLIYFFSFQIYYQDVIIDDNINKKSYLIMIEFLSHVIENNYKKDYK